MSAKTRRKPSRRQLPRSIGRIPAAFRAGAVHARGHVSRLSRRGLFFSTVELPAPGENVRVKFQDETGQPIELVGTVRWNTAQIDARRSGFGMEFEGVPDTYLEFYERILTR